MLRIGDLDPTRLHVLPLGIGNAFTGRYFNTSFLLLAEGRAVLVDCPAPLRRVLRDAGRAADLEVDIPAIQHIVLTHLHGDHCNGLEELGFYKRFLEHGARARLYLLPELVEPLWEHRLKASMGLLVPDGADCAVEQRLSDFFHVHPWEPERRHQLAAHGSELVFEVRRTEHFIPCFGFKVRFRGATFAYSADTAYDPEHIQFLRDGDLILHETGEGSGHTPLKKLAALPADIRARMKLVHISDDFDRENSPIPVVEEGRLLDVHAMKG